MLATDRLSDEALGIDEADELASTQDELIQSINSLVFDAGRMEADDHVDVVVDLVRVHRHFTHVVVQTKLLHKQPCWLVLTALELRHRVVSAHDWQRTHHANDALAAAADLLHSACDLILQEGLFLRIQERKRLLLLETLYREPEIEVIAFGIDLHATDVVFAGFVFIFCVRVGRQALKHQLAISGFLELQQEISHRAGIVLKDGRHHAIFVGSVEADGHRLVAVQVFQNVLSALAKRVEFVFGKVGTNVAEAQAADEVVDHRDDGDDKECSDVLAVHGVASW